MASADTSFKGVSPDLLKWSLPLDGPRDNPYSIKPAAGPGAARLDAAVVNAFLGNHGVTFRQRVGNIAQRILVLQRESAIGGYHDRRAFTHYPAHLVDLTDFERVPLQRIVEMVGIDQPRG